MLIGYARVGPVENSSNLDEQQRDLESAGVMRVYKEMTSSTGERIVLERAIAQVSPGDALVVTKLDRLARSITHLTELVQLLQTKSVYLKVLHSELDTEKRDLRSILDLLDPIAQFERDVKIARQQEGIAKAKAQGRYRGRSPTARAQWSSIIFLKDAGETAADIARRLDISVSSVNRVLKSHKEKLVPGRGGVRPSGKHPPTTAPT